MAIEKVRCVVCLGLFDRYVGIHHHTHTNINKIAYIQTKSILRKKIRNCNMITCGPKCSKIYRNYSVTKRKAITITLMKLKEHLRKI